MSDPTNLARNGRGSKPTAPARDFQDIDFEAPDEESMQLIEEHWRRFCRTIGLEGDIPDIRETFATKYTEPAPRWRRAHWLVRPFVAVYDWLNSHP